MRISMLRRRARAQIARRQREDAVAAHRRIVAPPSAPVGRAVAAEALGTALLVAAVVGSGIHAAALSRDTGLTLLENTIASVAALLALILLFAPVSGAHFNPAVTLASGVRGERALAYVIAQVLGGVLGCLLANAMFDLPLITWSLRDRTFFHVLLAEAVATYGLVLIAIAMPRTAHARWTPVAVACWIAGAYWFTSSTSFANPAVTVARMFSNTFAGIAPASVLPFIGVEIVGAAAAYWTASVMFPPPRPASGSAAQSSEPPAGPS